MNDFTLKCNIYKCRVPLSEQAWVTRCMHAFCEGHGRAYFANTSPQIHCPICNELILKEVDLLQCETNPSDMILAGVSPAKAIALASKALKFWWCQIEAERQMVVSKMNYLEKRNNDFKFACENALKKEKRKSNVIVNDLKRTCCEQAKQIGILNNQLKLTQEKLKKYKHKVAANECSRVADGGLSPHWFSGEADQLQSSPSLPPFLENGESFSFQDSHLFRRT